MGNKNKDNVHFEVGDEKLEEVSGGAQFEPGLFRGTYKFDDWDIQQFNENGITEIFGKKIKAGKRYPAEFLAAALDVDIKQLNSKLNSMGILSTF